jgi:hypothetical protein
LTASPFRVVTEPAGIAPAETIDSIAADLSDGALSCREHRRHAWRKSTASRESYGFRRVETCPDCGSERWQELDRYGYIVRSGINYSEGYLMPKGSGRIDARGAAQFRLEALTRMVTK